MNRPPRQEPIMIVCFNHAERLLVDCPRCGTCFFCDGEGQVTIAAAEDQAATGGYERQP